MYTIYQYTSSHHGKASLSILMQSSLLVVLAVSSLSGVDHPEDQREHHSARNHGQAYVDPSTVFSKIRAIVLVDGGERLANERAVLQLGQERAVVVQAEAHADCCGHLPVDAWCEAAYAGAYLGS